MTIRILTGFLIGACMLAASCSSERELSDYRPEIQILREHIVAVLDAVDEFPEPRLLIWGVGYDSKLWCNENKNGTTIFIENIRKWAKLARQEMDCRVVMVNYGTKRTEAVELLDRPDRLVLELPDDLKGETFDVIVVDAPYGHSPQNPGRMKSIYMSSVLSHEGSHVFVDDVERRVEQIYSQTYLRPKFGASRTLNGRAGFAHFHGRAAATSPE